MMQVNAIRFHADIKIGHETVLNQWALVMRDSVPRVFAVFFCVGLLQITSAAELADADDSTDQPTPSVQDKDAYMVEELHDFLSDTVQNTATWIDSLFSDERYEAEQNKSRIKITIGPAWEDGSGSSLRTKFNARVALPETQKDLYLIVAGDDGSDPEDTPEDDVRNRVTERDSDNVAAGLQYFFLDKQNSNLSAVAGLRFSEKTPTGVFGGRYRRYWSPEPWGIRFTQRAVWLTSNEFILRSRLDFERPVASDLLFRQTLSGSWFEAEDGYFYNIDFALIQRLGLNKAISYGWNNQFQTEPSNRLEETTFRPKYRQAIWRDWLWLEVAPQIAFPRSRDFDPTPGIFVGFEIRFGD